MARRLTSLALVVCLALASVALVSSHQAGAPARVILLVDSSQGMSTQLNHFRNGLHAFIEAMPPETEIGIISTGGQLRIRTAPTANREQVLKAAANFASDNGANAFLETLLEADRRFLKPAAGRQYFVVMTTDADQRGEPRIEEYNTFMQDFLRRGGRAYAVVLRNGSTGLIGEILNNLTENSRGSFEVMAVANSMPEKMKALALRIAAGQ